MSSSIWSIFLFCMCLVFRAELTEGRIRLKRFLIFPRQAPTRHQFIAGIGIPADLSYESLTIGHVLKAEFFLPYNASVYRQNPYLPEYKNTLDDGNLIELRQLQRKPTELRWQIYAYIEHMLNSYGYNGRECLLQAICQANAIQFAKEFSVVHELIHIILSPSKTLNTVSADEQDFLLAEKTDPKATDCEIYDCNIKLLDWISNTLDMM